MTLSKRIWRRRDASTMVSTLKGPVVFDDVKAEWDLERVQRYFMAIGPKRKSRNYPNISTGNEASKTKRRRRNWGPFTIPGKVQRKPAYCLNGVRRAGGVNLKPGSCVERGNLSFRCQGRSSSGEHPRGREYSCGAQGRTGP